MTAARTHDEPSLDWARLGREMKDRRIRLGWRKREPFARHHDISARTLADLENHKRENFDRGTLLQVEDIYQWEAGSVDAVLAGGKPKPKPTGGAAEVIEELIAAIDAEAGLPKPERRKIIDAVRRAAGLYNRGCVS